MKKISVIILVISMIGGAAYLLWEFALKPEPPRKVFVTAMLDNRCELDENTFAVEVYETGAKSVFKNGVAHISALSDQQLRLTTNPAYPGVTYDGSLEPVTPSITLTSYCDVSERMMNIFNSMNKTFQ